MKANKDRLETLEEGGAILIKSNPSREDAVKEKLEELRNLWNELEFCTIEKEKKLFDANKSELFDQVILTSHLLISHQNFFFTVLC